MIGGLVIAWSLATAEASVSLEAPPKVGQATVVLVQGDGDRPRSGETVRVVHRPGLAGAEEQAIGITDGRGRVRWTPSAPGVATVRAGDETHAVHVAPASPRVDTWLLLGLLTLAGIGSLVGGTWQRRS